MADLLVTGGDIVTMNPKREVLAGGAVAVEGQRIVAVGSTAQLREQFVGTPELDARDCVVTPGMVNAHQHLTGDSLARACIPDGLPPGASIFEWSVPLHGAHTAADDELSATMLCVESALNGVTTLVEAGTVAHPESVAQAMTRVGVRGTIGQWGWDVDDVPYAAPADEVLERLGALVDAFPPGGQVEGWVTLVGHHLASDALLAGAARLARERGTGMTMHISPTSRDADEYLARAGKRPLAHFADLDVLGPHLLLAHAVWLDDEEVDLLLATRTAVAYCPWAYLRLGQGVTRAGRHAELVERGGRVALGCDAVNAADAPDLLRAAALAAGLAKDTRIDPTRFGAAEAFELATIGGAGAIGMDDRIGSLEPGKYADLVVHDATGLQWTPRGDVAQQLVWSTDGRSVRDVLVGGHAVVRDRACVTVDQGELRREAAVASRALFDRARLPMASRWPVVPSA